MLRITNIDTPQGRVLKIEGRLVASFADVLRDACRQAAAIDLAWVTFVDRDGAAVLNELARHGVRMSNVPPDVVALLDGGLS